MNTKPFFGPIAATFDPDSPNTLPFWNDPHISANMLAAHLDPSHDAASRRPAYIQATLDWIGRQAADAVPALPERLDILDLGCGPGLYAQRLSQAGHRVTGLDISARSIDYAKAQAQAAGLAIDYRVGNYLELSEEARYDLVMMIYCDMGALTRAERGEVLRRIRRALRPGGLLVFDVCAPELAQANPDRQTWSWHEAGFWSPRPHLLLEEFRNHPAQQVVARRIVVLDGQTARASIYYLRDYYFTAPDLEQLLQPLGFGEPKLSHDVIGSSEFVNAPVLFVTARALG